MAMEPVGPAAQWLLPLRRAPAVVHPFMDVFHVTDRLGCKLTNDSVITYIEQSLGMWNGPTRPMALEGLTALELTGAGRTGLISEVFAVLADMDCGVVEGRAWMHRVHLGCLIFLRNKETDTERMARIEAASDTSSSATPSAPAAAPWPPSPPPPSRTPSAASTLDKTTSETTEGGANRLVTAPETASGAFAFASSRISCSTDASPINRDSSVSLFRQCAVHSRR
uniref:ACT domain-containing protein ACR n=1 Tax=Oryza sativa subsp. japonica TaxID=39947 RepID=Q6YWR6_ORYSJ|nr:hypothetical protein [Oryza sativa Japonica Group]